jgi:hypothetical protein
MADRRPQLPVEIAALFPQSVVNLIHSFVPKNPKPKTPVASPAMDRDLRRIQNTILKGKSEMFLRDLEDFIL